MQRGFPSKSISTETYKKILETDILNATTRKIVANAFSRIKRFCCNDNGKHLLKSSHYLEMHEKVQKMTQTIVTRLKYK